MRGNLFFPYYTYSDSGSDINSQSLACTVITAKYRQCCTKSYYNIV